MSQILAEVGSNYVLKRWRETHGTEPDINSQEYKDFAAQVNRDYNNKNAEKASNGDNIISYRNKLAEIARKDPGNFPKEFYNALTNLTKTKKAELCLLLLDKNQDPTDSIEVNLPDQFVPWVNVIGLLYGNNKEESANVTLEAMKESSKYPWISGLLNHRLIKEDDFNLDSFDAAVAGAGGMDTSSDSSTSDTSTNTDTSNTSTDFNLDDISNDNSDLHIEPADGSGAIDSIGFGGGLPDDGNNAAPVDPNAPVYRVIDVIFDPKDPEAAPKIKMQDVKSGKTEIRDIFDIDV